MPDYEKYEKEKGFLDTYKDIIPGKEFFNYSEMIFLIEKYLNNPIKYNLEFNKKIQTYLNYYYENTKGDSCKQFKNFITDKIEN